MEENKFNFSEEEAKEKSVEESKKAVKQDAVGLLTSIRIFIHDLLDFRDDTDRDATIEAIKADIPLKGATAWILIFAIFVASIGLNVSSTAVVIGAMLISPLMGPILGVGMSLAINDIDTLKKSFINLLVMVFLSVLTAYLYFSVSPLTELTPELKARTSPNILDVLIAIFGGLALIVARTKKGTIASVIFGVAIATALMPPLCTAGYGLAVWNLDFFFGAMYLFAINTTFIALSTFIVLKVLRFPMLKYANSQKRKRIAQVAAFFGVIAMIPAIMTFINLLESTKINSNYASFLKNEIEENDNLWLQREDMNPDDKVIKLFFNGEVSPATVSDLENELKSYENIQGFDLIINTNNSRGADMIADMYDKATIDLEQKNILIKGLQKNNDSLIQVIADLKLMQKSGLDFKEVAKDAKIKFSSLESFGYSTMISSKDFIKMDTIPVAVVTWKRPTNDSIIGVKELQLKAWLENRVNKKNVVIKSN